MRMKVMKRKGSIILIVCMMLTMLPTNLVFADTGGVVIETVDSAGDVGAYTSLALDSNGNPCISYYDDTNNDLKYAYKDSGGIWHRKTVDSEGNVGMDTSLALDSDGTPCISYLDSTNLDLKYAYEESADVWHIETVDNVGYVGFYTSLALDSNGNPSISYHDNTNHNLKYAFKDSVGDWHIETVNSEGFVGIYTSLALDSNGNPSISYYDVTMHNLKYTYKDSEDVWHTETVNITGFDGTYTSLVLDSNGNPCISYLDGYNGYLKYSYKNSSGVWHTDMVDTPGDTGYTSLALDSNGNPYISYINKYNGYLKYAYKDSGDVWHTKTVDSTGDVDIYTSLALDSNGKASISYSLNTNSDLKYAILYPDINTNTSISMGSIKQDEMKTEAVNIINNGLANLIIDRILSSSEHFTVIEDIVGTVIYPGESKVFIVKFTPTDIGPYNGEIEIQSNDPDNVIINVSAEATYSDSNADLAGLTVDDGTLDPVFTPRTVSYAVDGIGDVSSIDVTATLRDSTATLTINGVEAQSTVTETVYLDQGANLIPIVVTASDGVTQKAYILSINGTVDDADLNSLTLSEGNFFFDKDTTEVYVNVGNDVETIDVSAIPSDSKALVLINGSVTTSSAIEVAVGENPIDIMVVAQDASTKTYTVTVNRGMGDVNLSDIALSEGTISPTFNPATTAYTATVPYTIEDITVSPTLMGNNASVTVNGDAPSQQVNLDVGENAIHIVVTGIDGVSTKTYIITITRKEALTINNETLPIGIVGGTYQATLSAEGGTLPYTWTAIGLPAQLTLSQTTGEITGTFASEGNYTVEVKVTDFNGIEASKNLTLKVNLGCGNGAYIIQLDEDLAYTRGYTDDGIPMMTVNEGITGFKYFSVAIAPVTGHVGNEVCVFVHLRNGQQIGLSYIKADLDSVNSAGAAFNIMPGDIIKAFIVDDLTNDSGTNPEIL